MTPRVDAEPGVSDARPAARATRQLFSLTGALNFFLI